MRQTNYQARKKLKEMGYSDIITFGHSRFRKDIYGWDGVCIRKVEASELFDIFWFQIKTGRIASKEKEKLKDFCFSSGQKGIIIEKIAYQEKYRNRKGSYTRHKIKVTDIGF
jgi:hypothetical protein